MRFLSPLLALLLLLSGCAGGTESDQAHPSPAPEDHATHGHAPDGSAAPSPSAGADDHAGHGEHQHQDEMVFLPSGIAEGAEAKVKAKAFRDQVIAAAERNGWTSLDGVRAAGFEPMVDDPEHWSHAGNLEDGRLFDPDRPEFLVVVRGQVEGVMFTPESMTLEPPEPPGAPYMRWHYHAYAEGQACLNEVNVGYYTADGSCRPGDRPALRSPAMTHVWLHDDEYPFAAMLGTDDEGVARMDDE